MLGRCLAPRAEVVEDQRLPFLSSHVVEVPAQANCGMTNRWSILVDDLRTAGVTSPSTAGGCWRWLDERRSAQLANAAAARSAATPIVMNTQVSHLSDNHLPRACAYLPLSGGLSRRLPISAVTPAMANITKANSRAWCVGEADSAVITAARNRRLLSLSCRTDLDNRTRDR